MMNTDRLFRPQSLAVIGGSWAKSVIEQCQRAGFAGEIWPVHPNHQTLCGLPCYRSVADLPAAPDATFIGVNRHATVQLVSELRERGAGGVVCFASGFSEAQAEDSEGVQLQADLVTAAADMPIIGPNCYGLINYLDGALLWPDQHGGQRVERGVALITQSSNIAINLTMQQRGLPIAYVLTAGNQAQLSIGELGQAVLTDPRVTALGLYVEGFGDVAAFERMAQEALSLGKPVIAIKAGRSEQARQAMVSHTNSISGADTAADAFLKRLGIARVFSLTTLLETLKLIHLLGPLPGTAIQSMSCSGGEAGLMSDASYGTSVTYPPLTNSQQQSLRAALGPMVALANPLDYHTYVWGDTEKMTAAYAAMMQRNADLTVLVMDYPRVDRCDGADWLLATRSFIAAQQQTGARAAVLATLPDALPETVGAELMAAGIVPMMGVTECIDAIEAASVASSITKTGGKIFVPVINAPPLRSSPRVVTEAQAKQWLAEGGLNVPASHRAESLDALEAVAHQVTYPVVLKGEGIAHKTEHHAVRLNLHNASSVMSAARELDPIASSFLVETYVEEVICELLVSVVRDPVLGYLLTLAAGGVYTEIMHDAVQLLLPVDPNTIDRALHQLRIASVLDGYRGKPGADVQAIINTVMAVQTLILQNTDRIVELEINPLLCRATDAIVADALISMAD